jgi:hypothetical protein
MVNASELMFQNPTSEGDTGRLSTTLRATPSLLETVPDPGKGVCADPVNGDAILGKGGSDPQSRNKERQLSPDKGGGKMW